MININDYYPLCARLISKDKRIKLVDFCASEDNFSYIPTKTQITIPCWLPTIAHEISHFVHINKYERLIIPDWGFANFSNEKFISNKKFFAAYVTEVKIRSIALHLQNNKQQSWLYNHIVWGEMAEQRLPFGRFKCVKELESWEKDLASKTFKAWSFDRISHEWDKRFEYVQNWMETKG